MMKKKKGLGLLTLITGMLLLTACGGSSTTNSTEVKNNITIETETTIENDNTVTEAEITTGNDNTVAEAETTAEYITPEVENGEIVIDTTTLTEHPLYVNYDSNGTNIQMIAVKASDGSFHLSLNTCQACNPSPMAYFVEKNGRLECQNCGNVFTMDSVGSDAGGCNPMNINYQTVDGNLIVNTEDLDSYADKFTSWSGPVQ